MYWQVIDCEFRKINTALGLINKIENNPNLGLIKHLTTEKK